MGIWKGDLQVLLYTKEDGFALCRDFCQAVLEQEPYYTWDEGPNDRGAKFHAGRGTIGVLCQDHPGTTGPVILNLETEAVDEEFGRLCAVSGLSRANAPRTTSYGTRFFTLTDPVGNRINLYRSVR